jgi:hypothetical protein
LGKTRLIDTELDIGTKLDATEVVSAELIDGAELTGNTWLTGGSTRRTQRQRVDVDGSARGA